MTYDQVLAMLNRFMEENGLRQYCRTVCKPEPGDGCCNGRYQAKVCRPACDKQLVCAGYVCQKLEKMLDIEKARWLRQVNKYVQKWARNEFGNAFCHNYDYENVKDKRIPGVEP